MTENIALTSPSMTNNIALTSIDDAPKNNNTRQEIGLKWRQYVIAAMASGTVMVSGYTSMTFIAYKREFDMSDLSVIKSLYQPVGTILGFILGAIFMARFGRKITMVYNVILLVLGYLFVMLSMGSIIPFIIGHELWSLAYGVVLTVIPTYYVEISTVEARGRIMAFLCLFIKIGELIPGIIYQSMYHSYYKVWVTNGLGLFFLLSAVAMFWIPESPKYLLLQNKSEEAAQSLMTLRGRTNAGVQAELAELTKEISVFRVGKYKNVFTAYNGKTLGISFMLCISGYVTEGALGYLPLISRVEYIWPWLIIPIAQILGLLVHASIVSLVRRKVLLLISFGGFAGSLFGICIEKLVDPYGSWGAWFYLTFAIFLSLGLLPLQLTIMSEILPIGVKPFALPIITCLGYVIGYGISALFIQFPMGTFGSAHYDVVLMNGLLIVFFLIGFLFTLFVIPETKGKTSLEIADIVEKRSPLPCRNNCNSAKPGEVMF